MNKERYIKELKTYRHLLPKQTIKTLRGQALSGDLESAKKRTGYSNRKTGVMPMAHRQAKVFMKYYDSDYKGQLICSLSEGHRIKGQLRRDGAC